MATAIIVTIKKPLGVISYFSFDIGRQQKKKKDTAFPANAMKTLTWPESGIDKTRARVSLL